MLNPLLPSDSHDFRKAMSCFATGIAVATILHPHQGPVGVTINSLVSVSLDPMLILFCLGKNGHVHTFFHDIAKVRGSWAVSILSEKNIRISQAFTSHNPENWTLSDMAVEAGSPPLVKNAVSWLVGTFTQTIAGGDHTIFLGQVEATSTNTEENPLLYHRSQYAQAGLPLGGSPEGGDH